MDELTIVRSGAVSKNCTTDGAGAVAYHTWIGPSALSKTVYFRCYMNFASLPTASGSVLRIDDVDYMSAHLTPGGKFQFFGSTTQYGSDSAVTVAVGTLYRVELSATYNATLLTGGELQINGMSVGSVSGLSLTPGAGNETYQAGWIDASMGNSISCYLDDIAINDNTGSAQNSWPGDSKIVLSLPISDKARGSWVSGSGSGTGTTNLWDAINNTPPVGVVSPDGVTACISNTISGATAPNGDFNMATYASLGIQPWDTINCITMVIVHGEDAATGAKTGTFNILSNPTQSGTDTVGLLNVAGFGPGVSGAVGTYPTGWAVERGTVQYNPVVDVNTSPVCRITKTDTGTRYADCCFMGLYIDYTPRPRPRNYVVSQAVKRASHF